MKIEVRNLGPIKKGEIDLDKRVTVFVGYNNSGKTYMSQLLWGLNSVDYFMSFDKTILLLDMVLADNIFEITKDSIIKLLSNFSKYCAETVVPDLFKVKSDYFEEDEFSIVVLNSIEGFIEKMRHDTFRYNVLYKKRGESSGLYTGFYSFIKTMNSLQIFIETNEFIKPQKVHDIDDLVNIPSLSVGNSLDNSTSFKEKIAAILLFQIVKGDDIYSYDKRFFLPASRDFFPTYYKYIFSVAKEENELIDKRLKSGGNLSSIKALAKVAFTTAVDDLVENIYMLNFDRETGKHFEDLLIELRVLLGGDIIIKSAEGIAPIEFYLKLDNGKELEMYMVSSTANQLATLYLYFKYWAAPDDNFLIIDEPEENLHPENQIKLVNILMKFADRGNKILITTHSPLITDHINNYANLVHLRESGSDIDKLIAEKSLNMATIKDIKHKDFGVYFFNGTGIKEYEVGDYGAYFKDFQISQDRVHDISNVLMEGIYEKLHPHAD